VKKSLTLIVLTTLIVIAGCDPGLGDAADKAVTEFVPVFDFATPSSVARYSTSPTTDLDDFRRYVLTPAITRFDSTTEDILEGSTVIYDFLGTSVTLTVATFNAGTNGISSGVSMTGSSASGDIDLLLEFNIDQGVFFFEQSILYDDAYDIMGLGEGEQNSIALVRIPQGTITADKGIYGTAVVANYLHTESGGGALMYSDKIEVYGGTWNDDPINTGSGFAWTHWAYFGTLPTYAGITTPDGPAQLSTRNSLVTYLSEIIENETATSFNPFVVYKRKEDQHATRWGLGTWPADPAYPSTVQELKAILPSQEWSALSQFGQ
jgi:hypothetical protein